MRSIFESRIKHNFSLLPRNHQNVLEIISPLHNLLPFLICKHLPEMFPFLVCKHLQERTSFWKFSNFSLRKEKFENFQKDEIRHLNFSPSHFWIFLIPHSTNVQEMPKIEYFVLRFDRWRPQNNISRSGISMKYLKYIFLEGYFQIFRYWDWMMNSLI